MVNKVKGLPSADSSGIYRRPRVMLRLKNAEEIPSILGKAKVYPTPVCAVGADYSQTRCVGGDGGTTVDTSALDKILDFDEHSVRLQAGVRVGRLVRALAERGLELPLTPEIGNISAGALAVATLPQTSYHEGFAQMGSCVAEIKLITPQGKQIVVDERQRDRRACCARASDCCGIVHEVVLRIRPARPVKIDYRNFSLAEFSERFAEIAAAPGGLRLHLAPFSDRITMERRSVDEDALAEPLRHLADPQFRDAQRAARLRRVGRQRARRPRSAQRRDFRGTPRLERDAAAHGARRRAVRARMDARPAGAVLEGAPYLFALGLSGGQLPAGARGIFRVLQGVLQTASLPL